MFTQTIFSLAYHITPVSLGFILSLRLVLYPQPRAVLQ